MKSIHSSASTAIFIVLSVLPLLGQTEQNTEKQIKPKQQTTNAAEPVNQKIVYRPPFRGAPKNPVGAGTRGSSQNAVVVSLLTPDHIGLTTQRQPSLYWYLSKREVVPIVVTLINEQEEKPLAEIELDFPPKPGVQRLSLADHGIELEPNIDYEWSVTLIIDSNHRSKDIYTNGRIRYIEASELLTAKLNNAVGLDIPAIYAEEGLWYDALHELSALITADPQDAGLRQQRAALLEQVKLTDIAAIDRNGL